MRCENAHQLLLLADEGTLSPLTTWRLQRHLAACHACAAEHAAFHQLDATLRAADNAAGVVPAHEQIQHHRPTPLLRRRVLLAGASAAAIAAIGTVTFVAPNRTAFAQVQQAMANVRTAEWTETQTWTPQAPPGVHIPHLTTKTRVRARMNPPAILFERIGGYGTNGNDDPFTEMSLKTPTGYSTYRRQDHEIIFTPYEGPHDTREGNTAGLRFEILGKLQFVPLNTTGKHSWEMQNVTLNGKPALQFTFAPAKVGASERSTFTLWADPKTKRVLRTVQEQRDVITGKVSHRAVVENIHCDVSIPNNAFALSAPAGTPTYHENYWWGRDSTTKLTAEERTQTNRLIDETYAGILASDWKRTTAGWDLGYAASLPNSPVPPGGLAAWLRHEVAEGHQYKVMRRGTLMGTNDAPYLRVLTYGDANVPPGTTHLVAVTITPGILRRDGFQEAGTETFYFRRDPTNGLRIVGWQYPDSLRERYHRKWLNDKNRHIQNSL